MSTTNDSTDSTDNDANTLDDLIGEEVDVLGIVAGEDSMEEFSRKEAVRKIDEAIVESPYKPGDEIRVRGQTNHQEAFRAWAAARDTLDEDFEADLEIVGVDWPEDVDSDDDEWDEAVSEAFDERNETMTEDMDALVVVRDGASGDFLGDIRSMVPDRYTYDHSLENIDLEDAADMLGV